jgi:hypothetical protein
MLAQEQKCETLSEKQTKNKRTGYVSQVVGHLPGKGQARNSIPSTAKKKKNSETLIAAWLVDSSGWTRYRAEYDCTCMTNHR